MKQCSLVAPVLLTIVLAAALLPASAHAQVPVYVTQWGTEGTGNGQFSNPQGVAVDGSGNVYVADAGNDRVQKFTSAGVYLTQWGTPGTGDGQFYFPIGVAADGSGNVYVAGINNSRIEKFTSNGTYVTKWGVQFPIAMAVDGSGNVYVADVVNDRIQEFTSTGTYLTQWGTYGYGDGQFNHPEGVAVDGSGNVYVADAGNARVQKFTSAGVYLTQWGTYGTGDGQFAVPYGVAVDGSGSVYVADNGNFRIQKFSYPGADVSSDAPLPFALDPVRPNPAHGDALTVHFTLPSAAPARLELLDVAGRRIASREVGIGQHTLDLGAGRNLAPGLYMVRLTQGTSTRTTRVAVLR